VVQFPPVQGSLWARVFGVTKDESTAKDLEAKLALKAAEFKDRDKDRRLKWSAELRKWVALIGGLLVSYGFIDIPKTHAEADRPKAPPAIEEQVRVPADTAHGHIQKLLLTDDVATVREHMIQLAAQPQPDERQSTKPPRGRR
jgi:hypothetical protein